MKRTLNDLGKWLVKELAYRDIRLKEFANTIHTTPQNLSDILRGDRFSASTLHRWRARFENALTSIDEGRGIDNAPHTVYQAICSTAKIENIVHTVFGIQQLSGRPGNYRIVDEIQDITPCAEQILQLVELFNREKVADVHFRDVVMDCI